MNEEKPKKDSVRLGKTGRPLREERLTTSALEKETRVIASKLMDSIKLGIKDMTMKEKIDLLGKLLPYIIRDEEQESQMDVEKLVKKYMEIRIKL